MTWSGRVAVGLLLLAVCGVAGRTQGLPPGLTPEVEYDKAWDFGRYQTFAWAPFLEPAPKATTHRLLTGSIERALMGFSLS